MNSKTFYAQLAAEFDGSFRSLRGASFNQAYGAAFKHAVTETATYLGGEYPDYAQLAAEIDDDFSAILNWMPPRPKGYVNEVVGNAALASLRTRVHATPAGPEGDAAAHPSNGRATTLVEHKFAKETVSLSGPRAFVVSGLKVTVPKVILIHLADRGFLEGDFEYPAFIVTHSDYLSDVGVPKSGTITMQVDSETCKWNELLATATTPYVAFRTARSVIHK